MAHTFCICIFVYIVVISAKEHSPKLWQMSCETQCDAESAEHHINISSCAAPVAMPVFHRSLLPA